MKITDKLTKRQVMAIPALLKKIIKYTAAFLITVFASPLWIVWGIMDLATEGSILKNIMLEMWTNQDSFFEKHS